MSAPPDGGPAFPCATDDVVVAGKQMTIVLRGGMSLRDWFAGQALIGILGSRHGFLVDVGTESAPDWAYEVADGMLAARAALTTRLLTTQLNI
jgi:hypothetical protein